MTNEAKEMRRKILSLAYGAGKKGAHIAPSLSLVEIMLAVTARFRKGRDEIILSKGHGGLGYYCGLAQAGLLSEQVLARFEENGGPLPGQPSRNPTIGIPYSGGSLGMGLPYAAGLAHGKKLHGEEGTIYTILGDGECNEGVIWESAMLAKKMGLDNLVAIVDCNAMQSDGFTKDVLPCDLPAIWKSFGWSCSECDGHDLQELSSALAESKDGVPHVVIAHTVKGKGVSFMENDRIWHHNHITAQQYQEAMKELSADGT